MDKKMKGGIVPGGKPGDKTPFLCIPNGVLIVSPQTIKMLNEHFNPTKPFKQRLKNSIQTTKKWENKS